MRFLSVYGWEFVQNLPLAAGFFYGYALHSAGERIQSVFVIAAACLLGALLIRITESRIIPGPPETPAVTLANFFAFTTAVVMFVHYFSRDSTTWPLDLLLGSAVGLLVSFLQARAAGEPLSLRHTAAMSASFTFALLLIRFIGLDLPPHTASVLLAALVTWVIVQIEYRVSTQ